MPWLAALLGGFFGWIISFLSKFFIKRLAIAGGLIILVTSLLVVFVGVLEGLIAGLSAVYPSSMTNMLIYCIPPNATLCLSAVISVRLAAYTYSWYFRIIQWSFNF